MPSARPGALAEQAETLKVGADADDGGTGADGGQGETVELPRRLVEGGPLGDLARGASSAARPPQVQPGGERLGFLGDGARGRRAEVQSVVVDVPFTLPQHRPLLQRVALAQQQAGAAAL